MEEIKIFLTEIIEKEKKAIYYEGYKEKLDDYNKIARELNEYVSDTMPSLMREHDSPPFSDRFYEEVKEFEEPINPRHLFKISEYNNEKYNTVWACYVSIPNPSANTKKLTNSFLVAEIDQSLKIIAKMGVEPDTRKWKFYGGDEDNGLRIHNLGTPIKVERYLEPTDEWSLEEYLKDK
ncbi:hypothetical protein [Chryseobacterium sp. MEBOG07]|uniref:hypothetical protein n=1 Tax=Chryseobacterium sp. MEBOG07 TaxID=2879939 RepID=UPI001F261B6B|nr:hypothetical protein [Chryseobacterium sp. MEBOG07]UKB81183.1 hypothetical protein LF886_09405 [Chryseobacterium sp. MEBOG07]